MEKKEFSIVPLSRLKIDDVFSLFKSTITFADRVMESLGQLLAFILAKLIPYWLIGFVVLTICFVLAWVLYGILPAGHFLTIYGMALFFLPVVSGFGLVISNHSTTLQQAMFVMWFFMLILILMSGLFTPIHSMPEWAQWITCINPLRYFVEVMRTIYLRGGGFAELLPQLGALLVFALVFNLWAVKSYKKSS